MIVILYNKLLLYSYHLEFAHILMFYLLGLVLHFVTFCSVAMPLHFMSCRILPCHILIFYNAYISVKVAFYML